MALSSQTQHTAQHDITAHHHESIVLIVYHPRFLLERALFLLQHQHFLLKNIVWGSYRKQSMEILRCLLNSIRLRSNLKLLWSLIIYDNSVVYLFEKTRTFWFCSDIKNLSEILLIVETSHRVRLLPEALVRFDSLKHPACTRYFSVT